MKKLGLIGKDIDYSFSKQYFTDKFLKLGIHDWVYNLYHLEVIEELPKLLEAEPNLIGLNITIPYKIDALQYVDSLDSNAKKIGAINTVSIGDDKKIRGFNTDIIGFRKSLLDLLGESFDKENIKALVLGTGGAAQAIIFVLEELDIPFKMVSRSKRKGIQYKALNKQIIQEHRLIINSTPLGTFPNIKAAPEIPYNYLNEQHFLYDLVYNPQKSLFLQRGEASGAKIKNGLSMLEIQAEAAWDIWNSNLSINA